MPHVGEIPWEITHWFPHVPSIGSRSLPGLASGWFGLNNTHEEVVALSSGTAGGIYFMRLSVQA